MKIREDLKDTISNGMFNLRGSSIGFLIEIVIILLSKMEYRKLLVGSRLSLKPFSINNLFRKSRSFSENMLMTYLYPQS